jgi:hypothetical protein
MDSVVRAGQVVSHPNGETNENLEARGFITRKNPPPKERTIKGEGSVARLTVTFTPLNENEKFIYGVSPV